MTKVRKTGLYFLPHTLFIHSNALNTNMSVEIPWSASKSNAFSHWFKQDNYVGDFSVD